MICLKWNKIKKNRYVNLVVLYRDACGLYMKVLVCELYVKTLYVYKEFL